MPTCRPRLTGAEFTAWCKPLQELFDAVITMPEDNPGSLKPQEYAESWRSSMRAITMDARKP
jgi:hypothetical protein